MQIVKTKALISCAVTVKLTCAFVFAKAKLWLSHDAAHVIILKWLWLLLFSFQTSMNLSRTLF